MCFLQSTESSKRPQIRLLSPCDPSAPNGASSPARDSEGDSVGALDDTSKVAGAHTGRSTDSAGTHEGNSSAYEGTVLNLEDIGEGDRSVPLGVEDSDVSNSSGTAECCANVLVLVS